MADPTDVVLARIEGRLETLAATSELRLHTAEHTATKAAQWQPGSPGLEALYVAT